MNTAVETPSAASSVRIRPDLTHAFGGVWRLTLQRFLTASHGLVVAGLLLALGLIAYSFLRPKVGPDAYLSWSIGFYFTFLVPIASFLSGAGAIRDEMKPSHVDYILTRPVPRPAFIAFKFVSHLALLEIEFLLGAGVVIALGLWRHATGFAPAIPVLLTAQFAVVLAFSAFGFLCGTITSRYVVIGLVYGAIVEVGLGRIPTQLNRISMTHQVTAMLQAVTPHRHTIRTALEAASAPSQVTTILVLSAVAAAMVALAAALFSLRELSQANES